MLKAIFALCYGFLFLGQASTATPPTVMTTTGTIQGIRSYVADREVHTFLGVPYASPPIGDKRFLPATPLAPSTELYEATKKSLPCYQVPLDSPLLQWVPKTKNFSEDCLYLNIWRPVCEFPEEGIRDLLPIMVWIHGGGYNTGTGNLEDYDGEILASYADVIVVNFNYRLGALGFLNLGEGSVTGNMGISDQEVALKWIRDNAVAFGGDPTKITLFGQSAGSSSVGLHMLSPASRRLFRRAIMQSWSPTSPIAVHKPEISLDRSTLFSKLSGCLEMTAHLNESKISDVLSCLRALHPLEIIQAESEMIALRGIPLTFAPTYGNRIVPINPVEALIQQRRIKRTQLLIGNVEDEGSLIIAMLAPQLIQTGFLSINNPKEFEEAVAQVYKFFPRNYQERIVDYYLGNLKGNAPSSFGRALYDSVGDAFFYCPTLHFARAATASNLPSAYFYVFNHRPSNSILPEWMGVAHYDDVRFVFGDPLRNPENYTPEEQKFSAAIMTIWATFASTGRVPLETWPALTDTNVNYAAQLGVNNASVGLIPRQEACAFWAELFTEEEVRNIVSSL